MPQVLVVGQGRPDLPAHLDRGPAARPVISSVTSAAGADQLAVAQRQLGTAVQALDDRGPHERDHGDRRGDGGEQLDLERQARRARRPCRPAAPPASISRIRSRLNISATPSTIASASQVSQSVVADPVHGPTLSSLLAPGRSTRRRRRARRTGRRARLSSSGMPKVSDSVCAVTTSSSGSGVDHPALAQQQRVGEAGRDLLDVVGDQHGGRRVGVERRARRAWRRGPRARRGRGRRRARRAAAARGRSSARGRSGPACARPRSGCRRCARPGGRRRPREQRGRHGRGRARRTARASDRRTP